MHNLFFVDMVRLPCQVRKCPVIKINENVFFIGIILRKREKEQSIPVSIHLMNQKSFIGQLPTPGSELGTRDAKGK